MSNHLAIATVTATLQDILIDAARPVQGAQVRVGRPPATPPDGPTINLYLYHTTRNPAMRDADLPTRSSKGALLQRPQVALDLQYLLSFYGDETQLQPEMLMGSAVSMIHSRPVLSPQEISSSVSRRPYLDGSDLGDQIERVKLAPIYQDLEDIHRAWSLFFQIPYVVSVFYQATLVLIEDSAIGAPKPALPVRGFNTQAHHHIQPDIETVSSITGPGGYMTAGDTILLKGKNLSGDITAVVIGDDSLTPQTVSDSEIEVALPTGNQTLRAGVQGIQVMYASKIDSNVVGFALSPSILRAVYRPTGDNSGGPAVLVETELNFDQGQRVVLLLNENTDQAPTAYTFTMVVGDQFAGANLVEVPLTEHVESGSYLVRIRVDGAVSPLEVESGQYSGPLVDIP